ncbi:hypothetical protein [Streptomyces sp. NPDC058683]|uniref:hypothetical protein n=1 Tax=Streptomyces sp. NPDC058683 TaxID=3346597 RepID=UPI003669836E
MTPGAAPPPPHPNHAVTELREAGDGLHGQALREGHLDAAASVAAPCLAETGLLRPAPGHRDRLQPLAPAAALTRLLRATRAKIADTGTGLPLMRLRTGTARINDAMSAGDQELLCVQPHTGRVGPRGNAADAISFDRYQRFLERGGRIRTARVHIAKLATTLGSDSRAQLGYLIGRSGILDQEG